MRVLAVIALLAGCTHAPDLVLSRGGAARTGSGALRISGDRPDWPGTSAGVGPVLAVGGAYIGSSRALLATMGLQLYGAD